MVASIGVAPSPVSVLFSEPKIPQCPLVNSRSSRHNAFQCSSASRKFLNWGTGRRGRSQYRFQCSSASRKFLNRNDQGWLSFRDDVSVLFSEPKIPQLIGSHLPEPDWHVSVLFSEPKIPQSTSSRRRPREIARFSALQRAENSSIAYSEHLPAVTEAFQCSSASRKFLNYRSYFAYLKRNRVSVLFSEPKIPQCAPTARMRSSNWVFQCSSASRKFLNL